MFGFPTPVPMLAARAASVVFDPGESALHPARFTVPRRCLVGGIALLASLALPVSAQAGRLVVTGHDADGHCSRELVAARPAACAFVATGVNWVRATAPDPTKPVLILDRAALDFKKAVDTMVAAGATVPYQVVDPRSPAFATLPINTATYSAILVASSKNEVSDQSPQDLNEYDTTPDTDAINARAADIATFFNAGGGLDVMSGGTAGRTDSARYYAFIKITRGGGVVSTPFTLTPLGRAIGWQDARLFPGELNSINCCDTHISFELPAPESPLKVAELDNIGRAVTMVAQTDDLAKIEEPPTTAQAVFAGAPGVPASGGGTANANASVTGSTKAVCLTRTSVKISLKRPKGVRFVKLVIHVNGRKKQIVNGKQLGTGLKTKPVTVKLWKLKTTKLRLVVTTAAGRTFTYRRTYKLCPRKS
jgi:hypothetical protein